MSVAADHAARVDREIANYKNTINIHALPDIFHYWSSRYLAPDMLGVFGSADLATAFASELRQSMDETGIRTIVSVGAGDGSVEAGITAKLIEMGCRDFRFDCLELSPHLIARGRDNVQGLGLAAHVRFVEVDLTHWRAAGIYGAAFANHSLHHIVALEHVFDQIKRSLAAGGRFVVNDMIGRNGHMRWPEVEALMQRIWRVMPEGYRFDNQLKRVDERFANWDCSGESFEGIRAQDIMPELLKRFHFRKYVAWGGLTDIFVDRSFGHNLSPDNAADRAFIDHLAQADRALLRLGATIPTQVIGVLTPEPGPCLSNGLSPEAGVYFSVGGDR